MKEMENSSPMAETRKPRLPAMPAQDAEVIALSPATLTATNRFQCHVCGKGFQRDQNLQLHRRCHNLPWELKQRTCKEARKRVYVCPVPSCVHHDPSKALGDLSGIKKHFCRKHGQKKLKCQGCGKNYAVHSDLKAHMKTCGTKTYRCDCGTLFSKRENFVRHKAYCEALAEAIARHQAANTLASSSSSPPPLPLTPSTGVLSPVPSGRGSEFPESQSDHSHQNKEIPLTSPAAAATIIKLRIRDSPSTSGGNIKGSKNEASGCVYASSSPARQSKSSRSMASYYDVFRAPVEPMLPLPLLSPPHLSSNAPSSQYVATIPPPALSATALLQKAAQIGSIYSGGSFPRGLGFAMPSDLDPQNDAFAGPLKWNGHAKLENKSMVSSGGSAGLPDYSMMDPSKAMIFSNKRPTLDFLGVGGGFGGAAFSGRLGLGEYSWVNPCDNNLAGFL